MSEKYNIPEPNSLDSMEGLEEKKDKIENSIDLESYDNENPESWRVFSGEVKIEGKKFVVSYREKIIKLSERRQEETGVKYIRKREILPPFPDGIYLSPKERKLKILNLEMDERGNNQKVLNYRDQEYVEKIKNSDLDPVFIINNKNVEFYEFITDYLYPSNVATHVMNYSMNGNLFRESEKYRLHEVELNNFRKSLYFQRIYNKKTGPNETALGGPLNGGYLYLNGLGIFGAQFNTPIFMFTPKNKRMNEYFFGKEIIIDPRDTPNIGYEQALTEDTSDGIRVRGGDIPLPIDENENAPILRWCNSDLAIIPTKKGLTVLFFETGEKKSVTESFAINTMKENFFGKEEYFRVFGVYPKNVPDIPFSPIELVSAKEKGQYLVLSLDSDNNYKWDISDVKPKTIKK